ncbi:vWA domain-containing protein [Roseibacillus persicicus]|uniref:vWA domain-containing protein n=1 Tax=Roseibacillus persicicus TaxID=454148 RepID=UPI00280CCAE0|nr:VWA domain-containing protein [Roseibacillus persicicus]MDQ8189677.1 VWA domain-containing protein [Roseibacillus persicicus]
MNPKLTEIVYLLDCSQAMRPHTARALLGFNRFLREQRESADPTRVSLVLFNEQARLHLNRVPTGQTPPLALRHYRPHGRCALHDTLNLTINSLERKLSSLPGKEQPAHVLIALCSTGEDTASRRITLPALQQKIYHQRTQRNWDFLLLAPDRTSLLTANRLGIDHDSALTLGEPRPTQSRHNGTPPERFFPPRTFPFRSHRNQ